MRNLYLSVVVAAAALFGASGAGAAIVFEFGTIVEGAPQGGPLYARLTIETTGVDTVSLFLENTATVPDADGQSIHYLLLNVDPFVSGLDVSSSDPEFVGFSASSNGENDAGSMFDLMLLFDIAPPADRFLPGDSATMTVTGSGLTENSFDAVSAGVPRQALIHLISIPPNEDSAKITTPVPEPASFAALGLGALALLRRRRKA